MSTNSSTTGFSSGLTLTAVQNIIGKRKRIEATADGELVKVFIQSGGNTIPVMDKAGAPVLGVGGFPLMKTIYNVAANSAVAMQNPRNREILAGAVQAEKDGDFAAAHLAYNDYLNKIQVSFSVMINPGSTPTTFAKDKLVEGTVQLVKTDNGQLITLQKVSGVAATTLKDTGKLSLNDLLGITDTKQIGAADVFTPTEGATANTEA